MAGMDGEAKARAEPGGVLKCSERLRITLTMGVLPRVQLDGGDTQLAGTLDGVAVRGDEEARANSGVIEPRHALAQSLWIVADVEAALRSDFISSVHAISRLKTVVMPVASFEMSAS
jgi:hypothetical protein